MPQRSYVCGSATTASGPTTAVEVAYTYVKVAIAGSGQPLRVHRRCPDDIRSRLLCRWRAVDPTAAPYRPGPDCGAGCRSDTPEPPVPMGPALVAMFRSTLAQ